MNITLKLIASHGRLSTREPFYVADNEQLVLQLDTEYDLSEFIVDMRNGITKTKLRQNSKTIQVPRELIKAGQLELVVSKYAGGKLAKKWNVEPITIIEEDEGFIAYALIDEIERQTAEALDYAKRVPELAEQIKTLTALCNTNANAVKQLVEILKEYEQ